MRWVSPQLRDLPQPEVRNFNPSFVLEKVQLPPIFYQPSTYYFSAIVLQTSPLSFLLDVQSEVIFKADAEKAMISLLVDFNTKQPSWDTRSVSNTARTRLYELFAEISLTQIVAEPTRYASNEQ